MSRSLGFAVLNNANRETLFCASYIQGDPDAFRAYLENIPYVEGRWFNEGLRYLLELVSDKKRTISDVIPTLTILLQYYVKWISARQMDGEDTPYHVVCRNSDDHHEILELVIKELGLTLINVRDDIGYTALMYAVLDENVKCIETLIAKRADVNLMTDQCKYKSICIKYPRHSRVSPLIASINLLDSKSLCSSNIMMYIFYLLLDSGADANKCCPTCMRTPLMHAAIVDNVYCAKRLVEKGADIFASDKDGHTTWKLAAEAGSVNVLKYLIESNHLDKNAIDKNGCSVLLWAVRGGNIDTVYYILNQGVTTTTHTPPQCVETCEDCGTSLPYVHTGEFDLHPCMEAIDSNEVGMVRLFEEYGCQSYKQPYALRYAVRRNRVKVVKYLLSNYKYPLNNEYMGEQWMWNLHTTLLVEGCQTESLELVKLLLEHGADPDVNNSVKTCSSAINVAIRNRHVEVIALFIRGGVRMDAKSFYPSIGAVLPFEVAVWCHYIYAAKIFLVYGSSCGVFSTNKKHKCKVNIAADIQELLKEWNVHKNNVLPLQQRCRMVILNHLSPQADKKIPALPLPPLLIRYLNIPELDDIMAASKSKP